MKKNLGQLLISGGLVTEKVLAEGLQRQVIFGGRLGTNLMEMGAVSEESLLKVLSGQHGISYAEQRHFENISENILGSVPKEILAKYGVVPINAEKNRITVAMSNPSDLAMVDEVAFHTGKTVQAVLATELRIVQALEKYYGIKREARYIAAIPEVIEEQKDVHEIAAESDEPVELGAEDLEYLDPLDVSEIDRAFFNVNNRDDVAQTMIESGLRIMDDVFVFIIKGDEAIGWMSGGPAKPIVDFGSLKLPLDGQGILPNVKETRTLERLDGVATFESDQWLKELSLMVPKEVVVCPLVVKKHMVSAIVGFSMKSNISDEEAEFLVRVMRKASVALEVLILRSRIVML